MTYDDPSRRDVADPVPEDDVRRPMPTPLMRPVAPLAGTWHFCVPARPAPLVAADPAWLAFLGIAPPDAADLDPAWVDYLRR